MTTQQIAAPVRFGKYLLMDKIAAGGMAELFLAKQTGVKGFEKVVAIKRILPGLTQDQEFVGMFINEAKLAAILSHQHIVQIFDLGSTDGFYYIAMEYVMGKDLRAVVQRSQARSLPLTVGHALLIASRICAGLDYAHRKKDLQGRDLHLVHRDVSPQNILISYEGEIKLVDFGIAKAATQTTETRTGTLKGKLAYMSPEQATGKPLDHRSDIFSLGIVLYELVTGRRMFTGNNEFAILEQVRQAQIAPPSEINRDLPPEIDALVMKALAKDPVDRFQQASDMELAIDHLIAAKGYAFSSLSLANYLHALFEQDMTDDTVRVQRIAAASAGTAVEPVPDQPTMAHQPSPGATPTTRRASSGGYKPLTLKTMPRPVRLPVTKAFVGAIALLCLAALLLALWRPALVPVRQFQQGGVALQQNVDRLITRLTTPAPAPPDIRLPAAVLPAATPSPQEPAVSQTVPPPAQMTATAALTDPSWTPDDSPLPAEMPRRRPPGFQQRQELKQLFEEARRAYQAGDLAAAERSLRDALALNPQAVQGYHLLAMVLREQKKIEPAIGILTEGVHRFPGTAILHHDLGHLYAEKNVGSLAIDELQLALAMEPTAPWAMEDERLLNAIRSAPPAPVVEAAPLPDRSAEPAGASPKE
ncbi:MAG: protein kinase [Nitrospirae bacterium]|nr:protein kinase [Nitrospirota bacterium]